METQKEGPTIESLDLYGDLMKMKPKEIKALEETLNMLEQCDVIKTTPDRVAWHLYLFCVTAIKTLEGFAETVEKQQKIPSMVMEALILEMEFATCQRVVIGTSGKFVGFVLPDGQQLAYSGHPEGVEETQAYVISNLDLQNIAKGSPFGSGHSISSMN